MAVMLNPALMLHGVEYEIGKRFTCKILYFQKIKESALNQGWVLCSRNS